MPPDDPKKRKRRPLPDGARNQNDSAESEHSDDEAKAQASLDPLKAPLGDLIGDWLERVPNGR